MNAYYVTRKDNVYLIPRQNKGKRQCILVSRYQGQFFNLFYVVFLIYDARVASSIIIALKNITFNLRITLNIFCPFSR